MILLYIRYILYTCVRVCVCMRININERENAMMRNNDRDQLIDSREYLSINPFKNDNFRTMVDKNDYFKLQINYCIVQYIKCGDKHNIYRYPDNYI